MAGGQAPVRWIYLGEGANGKKNTKCLLHSRYLLYSLVEHFYNSIKYKVYRQLMK